MRGCIHRNNYNKKNQAIMKSIITVQTRLDKSRKLLDGGYPIKIRIIKGGNSAYIKTMYQVTPAYFQINSNQGRIKRGAPSVTSNIKQVNNQIERYRRSIEEFISQLDIDELERLSPNAIKNRFLMPSKDTFSHYAWKVEDGMRQAGRYGNANFYAQAINKMEEFHGGKLDFEDINYNFLLNIQNYHLSRGYKLNGIMDYLRAVRHIFNLAIQEELIKDSLYPFKHFKFRQQETRKLALNADVIKAIIQYEPGNHPDRALAKDLFLFSFYLQGLNFMDISKILVENVTSDRLTINRSKTHKSLSIRITNSARQIINKYIHGKASDDYLFSIRKKEAKKEENYQLSIDRRTNINKRLYYIGKHLGIGKFSFNAARHTWATFAKNKNVPVAAIQEMMSHSNLKTTQTYLDSLDSNVLDDFNDKITSI